MLNQSDSIDGDGTLSPVILSLSPEAKRAWVECHDAIQGQLARGSTPASSTRSLTEKQGSAVQLQMRWHRQLKIN
jgi:hypothetical protein